MSNATKMEVANKTEGESRVEDRTKDESLGQGAPGQEPKNVQELMSYIQSILHQMQDRFQTMSDQIITRIDDMAVRIDDLEHNINDLMVQAGGAQGQEQKQLPEPK